MKFDFYIIEAGEQGSIHFRDIDTIEASNDRAKETIKRRFHELTISYPEPLFVVAPSIRDRPRTIVATEYIDAENDTGRRLLWVANPTAGLA